jgi:hypothetical protein
MPFTSATTNSNNSATGNVAFPGAGVGLGDLLIVQYESANGNPQTPAIHDDIGNVWTPLFSESYSETGVWQAAWYCVSKAAGADTVYYTGGLSSCGISIADFGTGYSTLDQLAASYDGTPNGAVPHVVYSNPITTTNAAELIVLFAARSTFPSANTVQSPMTFLVGMVDTYSDHQAQMGYQEVTSIQTNYTGGVLVNYSNAAGTRAASFYLVAPPPASSAKPNMPCFFMG